MDAYTEPISERELSSENLYTGTGLKEISFSEINKRSNILIYRLSQGGKPIITAPIALMLNVTQLAELREK